MPNDPQTPKQALRAAMKGKPAKIAWPHHILHDAVTELERLEALIIDARYGLKHGLSTQEAQQRLIAELDAECDRIKTDA